MMIALIIVSWVVAVPLIVVSGLYVASTVLGRRARARASAEPASVVDALAELATAQAPTPDASRRYTAVPH